MFTNTNLFKTEALHFEKYGRYCDDPPGTSEFMKYWEEQRNRCINGYSVGDTKITGSHYFYLNFCQIRLTKEENDNEKVTKKRARVATKTTSFPDFWDGDYEFFWIVDIARNGIEKSDLDKLHLNSQIKHLEGGKHVMLLKPRRRGFSFKNGALGAKNYTFDRGSLTIVGAYEAKYLYPRGTMTMVTDYLNFIDENTAWAKRRLINTTAHVKSGFKQVVNGIELLKGYRSEVTAITFKDKPDAARGKDASLILLDECGVFSGLKQSYAATLPSVEQGNITTGQIIMYGTGGDMEGGTIDFESMYYDPDTYNLLAFDNIWDDAATGTCGWFIPDFVNKVGFIDRDGNSDTNKAKQYEEAKRDDIKRTARDPQALDRHIVERPFTPREGFLQVNQNIFPVAELQKWRSVILTNKDLLNIGVAGRLIRGTDGIKFRPDNALRPIVDFPPKKDTDLTGCIVQYQPPFRDGSGEIPQGLYIIVCDPYAHDKTTGVSIGAAYVIKRVNNVSFPDDMIVASYVGRPMTQDDYNYNLFSLAEYYNAKIGFENDRGNIIDYAKYHRLTKWLIEEVELIDKKEGINIRKLGRNFGISMGNAERKRQAEIYLRDWFRTTRGRDDAGNTKMNLHFIYDIALLDEAIKYNPDGNFDRISALLCGMYFLKDSYRKEFDLIVSEETSFFDRQLY